AGTEVCAALNLEPVADRLAGKLAEQVGVARGIELQLIFPQNARGADVSEKRKTHRAGNRNAAFGVEYARRVSPGERDLVAASGYADGTQQRVAARVQVLRIGKADGRCAGDGNEGDRRDGANVKAANVVFSAEVEALIRRNGAAGISGDERADKME